MIENHLTGCHHNIKKAINLSMNDKHQVTSFRSGSSKINIYKIESNLNIR